MRMPMTTDDIEEAVETAMRRVLTDPELTSQFWKRGYAELATHAGDNASQWVGRRILTAFIVAIVTAGLIWLVRLEALK